MIDLAPAHLETVKRILAAHVPNCEVRAFGSRVTWTAKEHSDLDLAVICDGPLGLGVLGDLREAFEESDLPMRVDVIDWHATAEGFRRVIEKRFEILQGSRSTLPVGWRLCRLGDVSEEITVGHVGPMASEYVSSGVPFLRSQDVKPFRIDMSSTKFITSDFHNRLRKSSLRPSDIVIVRTGAPGTAAIIPKELSVANCSDLVIVRPGPNVDPLFICYYINGVSFRDVSAHLVGAVQQHFNVGSARQLALRLPPLAEQQAITSILGALDDKIASNRRTNETLEAIARALFKSWFIDFDPVRAKMAGGAPEGMDQSISDIFPSRIEDNLPVGWRREAYREGLSVTKGKSYASSDLVDSSTALVTLKSFLRGGGYRDDGLKSYRGEYKAEQIVRPGELIVAFTDVTQSADVIGKPALVRVSPRFDLLVASLDVGIVRSRSPELPVEYLYYQLLTTEFRDHAYSRSNGSTVLHLAADAVQEFEGLWPSAPCSQAFVQAVRPMLHQQNANSEQAMMLAAVRDALLPKLLSGELRVRDAERMVGKVA